MVNWSDLIVPETPDEVKQTMLDLSEADGLPTTSWGAFSWIPTVYNVFADRLSSLWTDVSILARNTILETAEGPWLDFIAESQYDDARLAPVFTVGTFHYTDAGGGPHTVAIGDRITTPDGLVYRVTALPNGATLSLNGTLDLTVSAVSPMGRYNIPNGSSLSLVTSLPGVSVTNPAIGSTGTWITTLGADRESDVNLRARLRLKWATLATGSPTAAYDYWALSTTGVTRTRVDDGNPDGPGSLRVYIDAASAVATLQATINSRRPVGTLATAMAATATSVVVPGTVTVARASRVSAEAAVTANLIALAARIKIGGKVLEAQVIEAIMSALPDDDVSNLALGSAWTGTPDIQLGPSSYPQFTNQLVWVEV